MAFPTVSRASNRDIVAFLGEQLAACGATIELVPTEDGRKANLIARLGPTDRPAILLSGHTDVVPVDGQSWSSDPFRLRVQDGCAYGRGTADMKGFLASCLRFAALASRRELHAPVWMCFSHDEEIGCVGVRSAIDRLAETSADLRACIVGEPTSMRPATGHKGKIAARATCRGTEGHSALAPLHLNAVHLACNFVSRLRARQASLAAAGSQDRAYAVPYTTVHVGGIAGGVALNIVPASCTVDFEIRNLAEDDAGALLDAIAADGEAIAADERTRHPEAAVTVEVLNAYPGLGTPADAAVVGFVRDLTGAADSMKVAFGTEGGLFAERLGVPTVVCGPGSMDQGHKPDEFIALDQLAACDRMMERLLAHVAA